MLFLYFYNVESTCIRMICTKIDYISREEVKNVKGLQKDEGTNRRTATETR